MAPLCTQEEEKGFLEESWSPGDEKESLPERKLVQYHIEWKAVGNVGFWQGCGTCLV